MKASHESFISKEERLDKLEESLSSVNELKEILLKSFEKKEEQVKTVYKEATEKTTEEIKNITDFERFAWAGIGFFIFSILSWVMWKNPFFSVAFAFAVSFLIIMLILFIDWKFLPGDSIGKVSKSGEAISRFWLVIACVFIAGLWFGERISPDRISGEAQQQVTERLDNFSRKLDSLSQTRTVKSAKNEIEIGNDGTPNRQ